MSAQPPSPDEALPVPRRSPLDVPPGRLTTAAAAAPGAWRRLDWPRVGRQGDPHAPDVQETSRWLHCAAVYRRMRVGAKPSARAGFPPALSVNPEPLPTR